jgi:hypothetical protein
VIDHPITRSRDHPILKTGIIVPEVAMIIRRVGVWSVARLYGGISASIGVLIGVCFALAALVGGMASAFGDAGAKGGMLGAAFGVGAIVFVPIVYGLFGLAGGALGASLYNLFAGMFGGIEVEVEQ